MRKANSDTSAPSRKKKGIGRGNHPNSRKALRPKPWPKGVSGNPSGLPGTDLAALYARRFFEGKPLPKHVIDGLKKFNAHAFEILANRAYGKLKESQEITGKDGKPIEVTVRLMKASPKDAK